MKKSYDFAKAKRGAVLPSAGKTRITIWLDDDVLAAFRARAEAEGRAYQTLINAALRTAMAPESAAVTEDTLRRVNREELSAA